MAIYKIRKRNGTIVSFEKEKIFQAIGDARNTVGEPKHLDIESLTDEVIKNTESLIKTQKKSIPDVEDIQDQVEKVLIKYGYDALAKSYIVYREKRAQARKIKNVVVEVDKTMDEYLHHLDWRVNENANSGYSIGGLILKNSEKIVANYWLSNIYPENIGNAHRNGDYHIHDLGMFAPYCAGWSLRQLLEEGFNGVPGKLNSGPPKHLQSAVNQMVNFLGTLQNEWAGAQAFSSFDTYLAPFVHKYRAELEKKLEKTNANFATEKEKSDYLYRETYKYTKQQLQNFIFNMNVPSRWGTQTPFSNITLDWKCPEDMKDKALLL